MIIRQPVMSPLLAMFALKRRPYPAFGRRAW